MRTWYLYDWLLFSPVSIVPILRVWANLQSWGCSGRKCKSTKLSFPLTRLTPSRQLMVLFHPVNGPLTSAFIESKEPRGSTPALKSLRSLTRPSNGIVGIETDLKHRRWRKSWTRMVDVPDRLVRPLESICSELPSIQCEVSLAISSSCILFTFRERISSVVDGTLKYNYSVRISRIENHKIKNPQEPVTLERWSKIYEILVDKHWVLIKPIYNATISYCVATKTATAPGHFDYFRAECGPTRNDFFSTAAWLRSFDSSAPLGPFGCPQGRINCFTRNFVTSNMFFLKLLLVFVLVHYSLLDNHHCAILYSIIFYTLVHNI
jgi:hypothetical protein